MAKKKTPSSADPSARHQFRAVIDIGSNSIRLVIFDGPRRAPLSICNEKALCGLGRDLEPGGTLNPDAVAEAIATLKRFKLILNAYSNPPVQAIATSAVREASNGADFVEMVGELGFDVDIITGEEEAQLAAYGVMAVEPDADGLIGDMGGGSLELVAVKNSTMAGSVSMPIGPLSLMREGVSDLKNAQKVIDEHYSKTKLIKQKTFKTIYTVGGAWRTLARIHINLKHYPLSVLHHYELSAQSAIETCDLVARQSRRSLEEVPGISRKRVDTLPIAALALKALLLKVKAERVVVSAGGVREGLLLRALSDEERSIDPLYAAAEFYSARYSPNEKFGPAVLKIIDPLFSDIAKPCRRLLPIVTMLTDIAAYSHPDLRGRQAFDTALSAPFVNLSHEDRVWIALVLYCRYDGRNAAFPNERAISLLSWDRQQSAAQVGLALRFLASLAPKSPKLLKEVTLKKTDSELIFSATDDFVSLMGESPRKRLDALATALEREMVVEG